MKKFVCFLFSLLVAFASLSAIGQPIESGPYVAQPADEGRSFTVVWQDHSVWPENYILKFTFGEIGQIMEMSYEGGSADLGTQFNYVYPFRGGDKASKAFTHLEEWKKTARQIADGFAFIRTTNTTSSLYVETTPFLFLGHSIVMGQTELPNELRSLVFAKSNRLMSVPYRRWIGALPAKKGEEVLIGRSDDGYFFPAIKTNTVNGIEYQPSFAMKEQLALDAADRAARRTTKK